MGIIIFLVLCLNVIGMMCGTTASSTMNATAATALTMRAMDGGDMALVY